MAAPSRAVRVRRGAGDRALEADARSARAASTAEVPEDLPPIRVDFDQWVRVLEHLLGNALDLQRSRGAGAGGRAGDRGGSADVGGGRRPGDRSEEERGACSTNSTAGKAAAHASGTGIGLAITSEIVRFHGGRIWVEEARPHGARFVVTLAEGRRVMSAPEKPVLVLVVDDEAQIRRALHSILSTRGYRVLAAADGAEGLDLAIEHTPDLTVLDLALPGLSGLEVCRELRTWYHSPILVLSVRGADADKIAALDAGADDYVTKPFSAGELLARVRALLRRASGQAAAAPMRQGWRSRGQLRPTPRPPRRGRDRTHPHRVRHPRLPRPKRRHRRHLKDDPGKSLGPGLLTTTRKPCASTSATSARRSNPTPPCPRYLLTEPGVGFRLATA